MKSRDLPMAGLLLLLALFIWARDLSWISSAPDTLPVIIALPLFFWLGVPWEFRDDRQPIASGNLALAAAGFLLGALAGMTVLYAAGWTALLQGWLAARLEPGHRKRAMRLLILPFMAFPWLLLDGEAVGWWFRLTGSQAAGALFSLAGIDVAREGTRLLLKGIPIEVTAACSGLHTLQSMLIAGSAVAYVAIGTSRTYWLSLPLLILVAWTANTLRIVSICLAAIVVSPSFASGMFHEWGGWLVLFLMFCLSTLVFSLGRVIQKRQTEVAQ